jgi:hypothetical protein
LFILINTRKEIRNKITMNHVGQGQYKIIHKSSGPLETAGLATCSAISFIINNSHIFMGHIDALTNVLQIAKAIRAKITPLNISDIRVWYGDGMNGYTSIVTQKLIQKFAHELGISIEPTKEDAADILHHADRDIVECRKCGSKSGTLKIITHNFSCPYRVKAIIRNVGFMETVSSSS